MKSRLWPFVALFALSTLTALAQTQGRSLADLAKAEEQRRSAVPLQPSKVYSNADLKRFERDPPPSSSPLISCRSEEKYDDASGNAYLIQHCSDGSTRVFGSNSRTGSNWQQTIWPDRSQSGTDKCGNRWSYDAKTTVYTNDNGETRKGEGEFRKRLELSTPCEKHARDEPAPGAVSPQQVYWNEIGKQVAAYLAKRAWQRAGVEDSRGLLQGFITWLASSADSLQLYEHGNIYRREALVDQYLEQVFPYVIPLK